MILLQLSAQRIAIILSGLIFLLTICHITSHLLHAGDANRLTELLVEKFSFDLERNIPTFFSSIILFLSSLLFFLIGWATKHSAEPKWHRFWSFLAMAFLFLALDEAAHLHEHFDSDYIWGEYSGTGLLAWPWVFVYGGLALLFVLSYIKFWLHLAPFYKICYFIAGALYVGSALGFEMLEALEYSSNDNTYTVTYLIYSSIEEFFEMSAITFLIYTNLRYMAETLPETAFSIKKSN